MSLSRFRVILAVAALAAAPLAGAEMSEINVARQYGISYLPLMIIEDQKLIEKHGKDAGVDVKVNWAKFAGGDVILEMLNDPSIVYTTTPQKYANFMHKTGTIKVKPESWKDLFFPNAHNLRGG